METLDQNKKMADDLARVTLDDYLVLCVNPDRRKNELPAYWVRSKLDACKMATNRRIKFEVVYSTEDQNEKNTT